MPKSTKSATELKALIMAEVCKHPECASVGSVAIIARRDGGWDYQFTRDGAQTTALCDAKVGGFIAELRERYHYRPG